MNVSITGAPYSAVRETSNSRTLADGTHIAPKPSTEKIYRDSQGRERSERPLCSESADVPEAVLVSIQDPVAGFAYYLDQQKHIAYRYVLKVNHQGDPSEGVGFGEPRPGPGFQLTTENLGNQTIEGVLAEGRRFTMVIPVGAQGNDRSLTNIKEIWISQEIKANVLWKIIDPRGDMTIRLTDISRAEPDPSLFQPPFDYTVEDAQGQVTITFTRP